MHNVYLGLHLQAKLTLLFAAHEQTGAFQPIIALVYARSVKMDTTLQLVKKMTHRLLLHQSVLHLNTVVKQEILMEFVNIVSPTITCTRLNV